MNGPLTLLVALSAAVVVVALVLVVARTRRRPAAAPPRPAGAPTSDAGAPEKAVEAPEVAAPPPRLRDRLGRTRAALGASLRSIRGRSELDDETWDDLEDALLLADVGVHPTGEILDELRKRASNEGVTEPGGLVELLRSELVTELTARDDQRSFERAADGPTVWLVVGVNGVGKTTSIAKLARRERDEGHTVLLAAADTFRAAAAEQLGTWGERLDVPVVRGQEGADPGSVVFDAMGAAAGRGVDLVLVDTAGRLHTKTNLMEELKKLRRIVERSEAALTEILLVVDASTGQNGLAQARRFAEAVGVTGVVLTKLDGTAKGGIVLAVERELDIPVKAVGVGEGLDDLMAFDPREFVDAIVG